LYEKIRLILKNSQNNSAFFIITKLNPILRGWYNYFNLGNISFFRAKIGHAIFQKLMKWAIKKKHRRWGIRKIITNYFLSAGKFKNRTWNFTGLTHVNSRYNDNNQGKKNILISSFDVITLAANEYNIPTKLKSVHAYSSEYMKLIEFNLNLQIWLMTKHSSIKQKKTFIK